MNDVENGVTVIEEKIFSFGELLVDVDFSTTDETTEAKVRRMFAEIANIIKEDYNNNTKSPIKSLVFDHAVGELLNAHTSVEKLLKFK